MVPLDYRALVSYYKLSIVTMPLTGRSSQRRYLEVQSDSTPVCGEWGL